jgi:hypothetical protein
MVALQFEAPWVADCANNLVGAIRHLLRTMPERAKQIKYTNINKDADGKDVSHEAKWRNLLSATSAALSDPSVRTIIIDDLSFIDIYLQDHIIAEKADTKSKEMTIGDWVPYKRILTRFVTLLRSTSRTVIFTAHEENAKDESTGAIFTRINIPGKLADNLGGFFSDVWRTEVDMDAEGKPVYIVRAQPTTRVPQIGNSLGLPPRFKFTWEDFSTFMNKK